MGLAALGKSDGGAKRISLVSDVEEKSDEDDDVDDDDDG